MAKRRKVKIRSGPFGRFFSRYDSTGQFPDFETPQIQRGMNLAKKWREENKKASYAPVE